MASDRRPRLVALATAAEVARLERSHRADRATVRAQQEQQLRVAIESARRSPFWREHLRGVHVDRVDDLRDVPTSDRSLLGTVDVRDRMTTASPPGARIIRTSGSSGVPLEVHYAPHAAWWQACITVRSTWHRGGRPWHREISLAVQPDPRRKPGVLGAIKRARNSRLDPLRPPEELAARVLEIRPHSISGHPHLLIELGRALNGRHRPRVVSTHGETTASEDRDELRELFGIVPLDGYGTTEAGRVAWHCAAGDLYHVDHEGTVVEIIDDDGNPAAEGQMGQLVLTQLWNPLSPFVRYRIGDAAAWATRPCRCGYALPAFSQLAGRVFSWIVAEDGHRVAPQLLWASVHIGDEPSSRLRRYRVRQHEDRSILVEIVPLPTFTPQLHREWIEGYRSLLGNIPIEIREVDAIVVPPGEKFDLIQSNAAPDPSRR